MHLQLSALSLPSRIFLQALFALTIFFHFSLGEVFFLFFTSPRSITETRMTRSRIIYKTLLYVFVVCLPSIFCSFCVFVCPCYPLSARPLLRLFAFFPYFWQALWLTTNKTTRQTIEQRQCFVLVFSAIEYLFDSKCLALE